MASTPRYSISQDVPAVIPLNRTLARPLVAAPVGSTISQEVPAVMRAPIGGVAAPIGRADGRYVVSQAVPDAVPLNPGPSVVEQAAGALRSMYPNTAAAADRSQAAIQSNIDDGQYARAAGRAVLGAADQVGGFINDTVTAPAIALGGGVRNFVGGLLGSTGKASSPRKAATPRAAAATPNNPVSKAMAKGAAADPVISTGDDIHKFISARLKQGVTNRDLQALAGIAATVPAVTKSAQTNKDRIIGQAAAVTDQVFANEAAQAEDAARQRLGASADIARDPEYRKAALAAAERYRVNLATLTGVNPQGLTLQALAAQQEDQ